MTLSSLSFKDHFEYFKNKLLSNENFTFARYADGERMIIKNISILEGTQAFNVDKWKFNNNKIFSNDLLETCFHKENNYYYAISCKCCDPEGEIMYRKLMNNHNITFSNLFINSNYFKFIELMNNLNNDVVLIANKNCLDASYPFNVLEKIGMENDCVNWYESNKNLFIEQIKNISIKYNNKLFLISCGPLSEIIIHNLYINNPNNSYVDVGSSLDIFTHKKITRPYQTKDSFYYKKECVF